MWRDKRKFWFLLGVLLIAYAKLYGCATTPTATDAYLMARLQFNEEVKRYNQYYAKARPEQQENYRYRIDPYVIKAEDALDLWGAAVTLGNGDGTEMETFIDAKNKMIDILAELYGEKAPEITVDPKE